jgi:UDP-N-acetylmuramyl tripeptide synthase
VSEYEIRDSRRLTGPNALWERPGAVLDVLMSDGAAADAIAQWQTKARELLDAVDWTEEKLTHRVYPGGVSLALSAPMDALYAATDINETAWAVAEATLTGGSPVDLEAETLRLKNVIAEEANPGVIELQKEAARRGVGFLSDDDDLSLGYGKGSRTWPVNALPGVSEAGWDELHDIPIALVTGTNGKTTTVRLLAAIVEAAGLTPGVSSTDWIKVGGDLLDSGDWSGPGGARMVLRDQRVDIGLLETARGGMLRRGLAVTSADVGAILNVAEDHLGEWGVENLAALVEGKFVLARATRRLVLNADDPQVSTRGAQVTQPVTWFSLDAANPIVHSHLEQGGDAGACEDGVVKRWLDGTVEEIASVVDIPIALGGAARHNVANALAAVALAGHLGIPATAISRGLQTFQSDPEENPGRLNRFHFGDLSVLVDFAHNPHGLEALLEMAAAMPAARRLVLIGQAGDRTDTSIRELADIVWRARPDRIIVKEMPRYLRGREAGEIPEMIEKELAAVGAPAEAVGHAASEMEAVHQALAWAREGDLLLMLTHEARDEVLTLLGIMTERGWRPGDPLDFDTGDS